MTPINRSVAIIRPKQPFLNWANRLPDAGFEVSLAELQEDCLAVLIPEYDTDEEARHYIGGIYRDIFDHLLYGWCTEESWWPQDRTEEMFWQWFEIELHSMVLDSCEETVEKEKS